MCKKLNKNHIIPILVVIIVLVLILLFLWVCAQTKETPPITDDWVPYRWV